MRKDIHRRKYLSIVAGVAIVPKRWSVPLISSIALPAHAQTSCEKIDVLGDWLFSEPMGETVRITFLENGSLIIDGALMSEMVADGTNFEFWVVESNALRLYLAGPRAPWEARFTEIRGCVATKIEIYSHRDELGFMTDLVFQGVRNASS